MAVRSTKSTTASGRPVSARSRVAKPPPAEVHRAIPGLDRTDQRILRVLQDDGRITNLERLPRMLERP